MSDLPMSSLQVERQPGNVTAASRMSVYQRHCCK